MPTFNDARVRAVNDRKANTTGQYVLYWSQAYRRFNRNHALDYAIHKANSLKKPLVVYEGLRLDYPWASARHHRFMLDGMRDNALTAHSLGINYWPFVETPNQPARGLLRKFSSNACCVVTDDYPTFIVPAQTAALAAKVDVPVISVDSNSMIPLRLLGPSVSAAAHLRPRLHKQFADAWENRAIAEPIFPKGRIDPTFAVWDHHVDLDQFIAKLPIDQAVHRVRDVGGVKAASQVLDQFVTDKLTNYGEGRNNPNDPKRTAASKLSAHLRHGHISIQECVERVLTHAGDWKTSMINIAQKNKREGFFHPDDNVNSFLDEALTWRDVGYHWHYMRNADRGFATARQIELDGQQVPVYFDLASVLPTWAMNSLKKHETDRRQYHYSLEEFENSKTHDKLWNAAQKELVVTGRIHNYLRMLWGKKVLEWSDTVERAYQILEHLNNKYAIDGRDPNSYTGIFWCFGLFDRPWIERPIFGQIRYMTSDSTAKKYDLAGYYQYTRALKYDDPDGAESHNRSLFE